MLELIMIFIKGRENQFKNKLENNKIYLNNVNDFIRKTEKKNS